MKKTSLILLSAAMVVCGLLTTNSPVSASHPAALPHTHPGPGTHRFTPRKATPNRHTVRHIYGDGYGGLSLGASFLAGGTVSTLSTMATSGVIFEGITGWRMNPWVALEATGLVGFHLDNDPNTKDIAVLMAGCLNAKLYLSPTLQRFEPYILLGVGVYGAGREETNIGALGIGVQGGVGVDVRLNPAVSLSADAVYRGALWEDANMSYFFQSFVTLTTGVKLHL